MEGNDPCVTCNADAMCTKVDSQTNKTKHTFIKVYKKEHRVMRWHFHIINSLKVGGTHQAPDSQFGGLRFSWCAVGDLCNVRNVDFFFYTFLL